MKLLFTLLFLTFVPLTVHAQGTIPYFDGVAIMNGFNISDDDILIFDKPEGRVIEITLWCTNDCPTEQSIRSFYSENLSSMGWKQTETNGYTLNNAHLTMDVLIDPSTKGTIILLRSNG